MSSAIALIFAACGGILPALVWLYFWLREDEHPEPKHLIFISFILGMASVFIVLPFQFVIGNLLKDGQTIEMLATISIPLAFVIVMLWASVEELCKYVASHVGKLRRYAIDEPLDWIIYMISTALGFAAMENTLFLINPLVEGDIAKSLATGNLRFVGATLLHVISSASVGVFLAFAFYKPKRVQVIYKSIGLLVAILLHTLFNLFIIIDEHSTLLVFGMVWIAIIVLIIIIERIKRITPTYIP